MLNENVFFERFKLQPHKMVKRTQTIRRLLPTNCLSVFNDFCGVGIERVKVLIDSHHFSTFVSPTREVYICWDTAKRNLGSGFILEWKYIVRI